MGGYISTYLTSAPATDMKDASGNTVPAPTGTPLDAVFPLPPARDEQQTTVESKKDNLTPPETPPPPPSPVPPIEEAHKPLEKTVTVEPLPAQQNINVNNGGGKNKKKGKKH
jgi:hypothetical protein